MILFFAVLLCVSSTLNVPVWWLARRRGEAAWWLPLLGVPAVGVWIALAALGVGPQSLANVLEVIGLAGLSVLACHAQVLLLDRWLPASRRTTLVLSATLVCVAVLLRLWMPLLPE